jgi:nuclear pore complex protein Nup50
MERERERERFPFGSMSDKRKRRTEENPSSSDCNDQAQFRPKRITAVPPFDVQRAESSRQHVRALNTQFASWVQKQLKDHPDELWQDGVQDYIKHASEILVKFSDVVDWLNKNASSIPQNVPVSMSKGGLPSIEKQVPNEDNKSEVSFLAKDDSRKSGLGLPSTGLWSFGLISANQSSPATGSWSFGLTSANQNSSAAGLSSHLPVPPIATGGTSNDQEEDSETVDEPPSPSVKRTEEPGTVVVHEVKCKLYVKPDNSGDEPWKNMGMGQLYIKCKEDVKRGTKEAKATIVIRNDVGKVVLNALLYPKIKLSIKKNTITTIFHTADGEPPGVEADGEKRDSAKPRMYLMKLKSEDDAKKLEEAVITNAPVAD